MPTFNTKGKLNAPMGPVIQPFSKRNENVAVVVVVLSQRTGLIEFGTAWLVTRVTDAGVRCHGNGRRRPARPSVTGVRCHHTAALYGKHKLSTPSPW